MLLVTGDLAMVARFEDWATMRPVRVWETAAPFPESETASRTASAVRLLVAYLLNYPYTASTTLDAWKAAVTADPTCNPSAGHRLGPNRSRCGAAGSPIRNTAGAVTCLLKLRRKPLQCLAERVARRQCGGPLVFICTK